MAALYLAVRRRGEQAGIKGLPAHTFRHTTGTRLLESGMQEADVRVFMGWSRGSRMLERDTQSGPAERALEAGFDLVEVCPGQSEWDANVGARILYKLCSLA